MTTQITIRAGSLESTTTQLDYILLDGSSSMASRWWESLDAIETYVKGIKAQGVKSRLIVSTFDSTDRECIHRDILSDQWDSIVDNPIGSHGGQTPLYDAIHLMIKRAREMNPQRAHLIIVTDGEENCSQFTNLTQAKALLDWARALGWAITFIGCDFDNSSMARSLGANPASAIGVRKEKLTEAVKALGEKRVRYGLNGEPIYYTDEERMKFGGYIPSFENGAK